MRQFYIIGGLVLTLSVPVFAEDTPEVSVVELNEENPEFSVNAVVEVEKREDLTTLQDGQLAIIPENSQLGQEIRQATGPSLAQYLKKGAKWGLIYGATTGAITVAGSEIYDKFSEPALYKAGESLKHLGMALGVPNLLTAHAMNKASGGYFEENVATPLEEKVEGSGYILGTAVGGIVLGTLSGGAMYLYHKYFPTKNTTGSEHTEPKH